MKALPLSFAMVVGAPPLRDVAPAGGGSSFAATLSAQTAVADAAPGVTAVTPTAAPTANLAALSGMPAVGMPSAPVSGRSSGSLPSSAGIFGYGRSGMFDTTGRAAIDSMRPAAVASTSRYPVAASNLHHDYRDLMARLAREFDVPQNFITAVMLAESGGNPNAVGDSGHSVGLFQLHDRGMGYGMGDDRYDPEKNARVGVAGLAGSWHEGVRRGLSGEELVRFAYDDKFNPGGGWAYQGDRVVANWRTLGG